MLPDLPTLRSRYSQVLMFPAIYIALGFLPTVLILLDPEKYAPLEAYEKHKVIKWIWPETVSTHITWVRIALAIAMLTIPFVRIGVD